MSRSKQESVSLDQHLAEIHEEVTRTHYAMLTQSMALDCLLQSVSLSPNYRLKSFERSTTLPVTPCQSNEMAAEQIHSASGIKHLLAARGTTCLGEPLRELCECESSTSHKH